MTVTVTAHELSDFSTTERKAGSNSNKFHGSRKLNKFKRFPLRILKYFYSVLRWLSFWKKPENRELADPREAQTERAINAQ